MTARLNVNIDHVATVREARKTIEPSIASAAVLCEKAGADGITVHLRGDRRHIQDADLDVLRRIVTTYLNVEMAATDEMVAIAKLTYPDAVSLVPESPTEITTEGGLDVIGNFDAVADVVKLGHRLALFACASIRVKGIDSRFGHAQRKADGIISRTTTDIDNTFIASFDRAFDRVMNFPFITSQKIGREGLTHDFFGQGHAAKGARENIVPDPAR